MDGSPWSVVRSQLRASHEDHGYGLLTTNHGLESLPIHVRRVGPEFFQGIIRAGVGIENVHDEIAVVLDHPLAVLVALDGMAFFALALQEGVDLFGDRMN